MLELIGISKIFPGVKALDDVSLTFLPGEIHALMGENGAGKSTLMKIITGIYQPDAGEIFYNGQKIEMKSFRDAVNHDINMVSQEIQVIPNSTVAENMVLDRIDKFKGTIGLNWNKMNTTARYYLDMIGLDLSPTDKVDHLSAAYKQLLQIARALSSNAKYILLDEPTSSLTTHESNRLITIIKDLKKKGVGIIFISHKIEEVLTLCDKVSVLRDGKYVGCKSSENLHRNDIVKMMIGREEDLKPLGILDVKEEKVLEVIHHTTYGQFNNLSFCLNKGEILGLYGLVGSGRTELLKQIIGVEKKDGGEVFVKGKKANIRSVREALDDYKIGYVTENRKEEGLLLDFSVTTNVGITIWQKILNKIGKIKVSEEMKTVDNMIHKMEIKTPNKKTKVSALSGGNQQKVSIAKWLAADCDILMIDEPTVGVDVGAKVHIHKLIWDLALNEEKSIILVSSDMPELIKLASRILIFKDWKIVGEMKDLNKEDKNYPDISSCIGEYLA